LIFLRGERHAWRRRAFPAESRWDRPVANLAEVDRAAGEPGAREAEVPRVGPELGVGEADPATGEPGAIEADRAAGEVGVTEEDLTTGEEGVVEADRAAGELRAVEVDRAAGELSVDEIHDAPGELGVLKNDLAAGKFGIGESDHAAGELGVDEMDVAAGELGPDEVDLAAGEVGSNEVTAIKHDAHEVKVQALPGHRCAISEMRSDDPDDSVADLAAGLEGKPHRLRSLIARVSLVGHPQVAAQHIDTGLPVLLPVISQTRHGVHPGQPDGRGLIAAQLPGRRGKAFVQRPGALLSQRPLKLLGLCFQRCRELVALRNERCV